MPTFINERQYMSLGPLEFLLILIPFLILAGIIAIVVKLVRNSNETRANTRRIADQLEKQDRHR